MSFFNFRNSILSLLAVSFFTSCAGLPRLIPADTATASKTIWACEKAFLKGKWQFVHEITVTLPVGHEARMIGVTRLSASGKTVHAVMMTIEGLVLFDGFFDGQLTVNRGVAPFDTAGFAQGLMDDIRFIFFKPDGKPATAGMTDNGFNVCRYPVTENTVVDLVLHSNGKLEIRKYENEKLTRKVVSQQETVPKKVFFTAYAPVDYRLDLRLISAEKISE